jgi:hypothetical protein
VGEQEHVSVGPVKVHTAGAVYFHTDIKGQQTQVNVPAPAFGALFYINYFSWPFSYLVLSFCPVYHFFVSASLSSSVISMVPPSPQYYSSYLVSTHTVQLVLFPDNVNNSSTKFVMPVPPK